MPKEIQPELSEVVGAQSQKTIVNYSNMLTRLRKALLDETPIKDVSEDKIIETIKGLDVPATSKNSMLNVAIVIKKYHDLDIKKLLKFREHLAGDSFDESKVKDDALLSRGITLKKLTDYMNGAYEDGDWVKYIVNYLLLTFQTRNEDLDLRIITNRKQMVDGKYNWLLVNKTICIYTRNDYKTVETYGIKKNIIRNPKFVDSAQNILGDKDSDYLLKTGDSHIIPTELNRAVSNLTYDKIGSTKYFKIMATTKKNIEKMADNRGTDPNTILHNYKLDKKVNLKKRGASSNSSTTSGGKKKDDDDIVLDIIHLE